jgi:hypothetical protein
MTTAADKQEYVPLYFTCVYIMFLAALLTKGYHVKTPPEKLL